MTRIFYSYERATASRDFLADTAGKKRKNVPDTFYSPKWIFVIGIVLIGIGDAWAQPGVNYSFGEWANDTGLPINTTSAIATSAGITNLEGLPGYTSLQELILKDNQIDRLGTDDFTDLTNLQSLSLDINNIDSIETGTFSGMQMLRWLWLSNNPLYDLNLRGAQFQDLTFFTIKGSPIATVDMTNAELGSQQTFNSMMEGGGSAFVGFREHAIAEMTPRSADLTAVTEFDYMFPMDDLETFDLANVAFADAISVNNYNEVLDLIDALESRSLNFLTIDMTLYTAQTNYFDNWDAGLDNELTVIPEPMTLSFLALGGLTIFRRRRK